MHPWDAYSPGVSLKDVAEAAVPGTLPDPSPLWLPSSLHPFSHLLPVFLDEFPK